MTATDSSNSSDVTPAVTANAEAEPATKAKPVVAAETTTTVPADASADKPVDEPEDKPIDEQEQQPPVDAGTQTDAQAEAQEPTQAQASTQDEPPAEPKADTKPKAKKAKKPKKADKSADSSKDAAEADTVRFADLGLSDQLLQALSDVGYETPSPIQAATIPTLLTGQDVIGQAQTGTGKTAAFALPLLNQLDLSLNSPQLLVLAPTRELAIQVAEAFQKYATHLPGFHVLPIYGGQDYRGQLRALKRGVHVVVGTPGRVMDHIRRGTLLLDDLNALVLDEADEMLRMGFVDDIEWILDQTPEERQIALFSATMPPRIEKLAQTYLTEPKLISTDSRSSTASTIRQRYWLVDGFHKLDAMTRILETEDVGAAIVFVRTKTATAELADKLRARGYASAALNGDVPQQQREQIIEDLKKGTLDLVIATDVAARGLDVERISHVINYDIPYDPEAYVHRIGRTGRAGREGDAILFVARRETRLLKAIERTTRQRIDRMELPTAKDVNSSRLNRFRQRITDSLEHPQLDFYRQQLLSMATDNELEPLDIAAALAALWQGDHPMLLNENQREPAKRSTYAEDDRSNNKQRKPRKQRDRSAPEEGMERFRIEVGYDHNVSPGMIVGAIANEAGLDGRNIGYIDIHEDHTTVDLPSGMPKDVFNDLKKTRVCGQPLSITKAGAEAGNAGERPSGGRRKPSGKPRSKNPGQGQGGQRQEFDRSAKKPHRKGAGGGGGNSSNTNKPGKGKRSPTKPDGFVAKKGRKGPPRNIDDLPDNFGNR